jgi:hypothetical protein
MLLDFATGKGRPEELAVVTELFAGIQAAGPELLSGLYKRRYPDVSTLAVPTSPSPLPWHSPADEVFTDLHVGRVETRQC